MADAMADSGGDLFWQSYKTVTKDDYVLSLFRITGDAQGQRIPGQGSKGPLLLQHGFLTDSITWFTNLTDEDELSVGSQLFLEGYDVWLGNIRGSRNSREHVHLDPDEDNVQFWDFSYPEFGMIDLPAMLQLIKDNQDEQNRCKKISYVGHSQGTIMAFYGLSHARNPSRYISQFVALAPCFVGGFPEYYSAPGENTYRLLATALAVFGIESLFGP